MYLLIVKYKYVFADNELMSGWFIMLAHENETLICMQNIEKNKSKSKCIRQWMKSQKQWVRMSQSFNIEKSQQCSLICLF